MANQEATLWQVRASAWELAAFSFRYPDATMAEVISSGEWTEAACEIAGVLGLELPQDFGKEFPGFEEVRTLRAEATRLFIGTKKPIVSPFEGVWRAADDGVQALLFVNPHSMAVERFMKSCGLGQPEGTNEPLDHIASQCELLVYLTLRNVASLGAQEVADSISLTPTDDALPGGSPLAAYETFLADHTCEWVPRFAQATADETRLAFYRDAAAFLSALVAQQGAAK